MGSAPAKATDWAAVTAWAAWATIAVYVVLGIFAWLQVLQARRFREEQARPFVIVDFEPGFLVYLTVENIGRTMRVTRSQADGGLPRKTHTLLESNRERPGRSGRQSLCLVLQRDFVISLVRV